MKVKESWFPEPVKQGFRLRESDLMSCILRIAGTDLNLKDLLKIDLDPDSTWEKDTPILLSIPDCKKHISSGARYVVS